MRKRWIVVSLLVGLLTIGITGGVVLAQEGGGSEKTSLAKSFASRVAAILGLDETQVESAMKQAAGQIQDEALQAKLDKMVESGRLTQQQADQYREWYKARPDSLAPGLGFGGFGGPRGHHGRHRGGFGMDGTGHHSNPATPSATSTHTSL